jgi:hypothetical protein
MKKFTIDQITGAWYEAYGEYMKDEYSGFFEVLEKPKEENETRNTKSK